MMLDTSTPGPVTDRTLKAFFGFAVAAVLAAIINIATTDLLVTAFTRGALISVYALIAVCCLAALRLEREKARRAMLPLVLAAMAAMGSVALATGWGLRSPGLYVFGVVCCMVCTVAPLRQGLLVTASSAGVILVLAWAEATGRVPAVSGPGAAPITARVLVQMVSLAVGTGAGVMLSQLSAAYVRAASEREQRFRELLGIAASAYWETDQDLRVEHISQRSAAATFEPIATPPGATLWQIPELSVEGVPMAHLQLLMESREPLRDVLMRWTGEKQNLLLLVSGEPRLDSRGKFRGYWGVARDVTAEHRARAALLDTELRYRDLFRRTPTPMVLHRDDVIVDANEAAATMFGFDSAARLLGRRLPDFYAEEDREALRLRTQQIRGMPPGEALPVTTFTMVGVGGQRIAVKATAVRADIGGKPALLSIYIDETQQRAASEAQQRSEALLRQVVSMSPDIITLTETESGRYTMVNDSFCRATGYAAEDVIGRTSAELGIWATPEDRDRLIGLLSRQPKVQDIGVNFLGSGGRVLPMLVSASRFERDGQAYIVINARDMTESGRARVEREAVLANASIGIAFTRARHFAMVNPHFEKMFGWGPGQLVGEPASLMWADEDEFGEFAGEVGAALARGELVERERYLVRRDGTRFLARIRGKAIDTMRPAESGTIWIAEDVSLQRQAESDLARARDAAEAASRAKSAFLANTSHEIRTPLNGLVGLARLARQPNVPADRLQMYLEQIGDSAETLSMIISDILDLSKIEAGRLEVETAAFDLQALLRSLHHAYRALAEGHGLGFEMSIDPAVPELVEGDALRVRQVLANFLHNALKFTAQGQVRLSVVPTEGNRLRFEVSDTGPGIDEATQARLFKPFTQADESITRRFGGTGLGLSICHELAELMGGSVGVRSAPGQGSCFHVELPLPAVTSSDAISGHGGFDPMALHGARVLLVEDNSVNMMIGVALLEQWGAEVVQAENGALAIDAVDRSVGEGRPFDVVLMDVQMPGMSGHEATRALRRRWSADQLPIIALTAAALVSEREQALAVGMNDFVTKPIEPTRLRQALLKALTKDA